MSKPTKRLGRGLSSLISSTLPVDAPESSANQTVPIRTDGQNEPALRQTHANTDSQDGDPNFYRTRGRSGSEHRAATETSVPVATIVRTTALMPNRKQPRKSFDAQSIAGLAQSIAQRGVVQPLLVRPLPSPDDGHPAGYEIIAGERRWRAAKAAGLAELPVVVRDVADQESLELALIENIQREDLNAIDRAEGYATYCREFGLSADEMARRTGEDRSTVANYLRLLELPDEVKDIVADGRLGMGHARAILGAASAADRIRLARMVVDRGMSVRAIEATVRLQRSARRTDDVGQRDTPRQDKSAHIRSLESRLQHSVGTKVTIQESRRKGRGRVIIEYYSLDDFDRIARMLGLSDND